MLESDSQGSKCILDNCIADLMPQALRDTTSNELNKDLRVVEQEEDATRSE